MKSSTSQTAQNKSCRSFDSGDSDTVVFRIHLRRRIQNPLAERRILPCKVRQRCTPHLGINLSHLQCCYQRSASKKRKILEIDDHVEDVEGVEDIYSQSGTETLHPNTQPIGEAEKLTNFQFLPIEERESSSSFSSPPSIVSSTRQTTLLLSKTTQASLFHASTTTLRKLPYIKSSHDSIRCVICIRSKQARKLFLPSASQVSRKLERIHSDISATSKGLTKLLLTFLDEYSHWCWIATIKL